MHHIYVSGNIPMFFLVVTNRSKKINASTNGWCLHWTTNIRVHNFKWCVCSVWFFDWKSLSMLLPKNSSLKTLFGLSINGNPFTIFFVCNNFSPPKFRCPNLKCHSQDWSYTSDWNGTSISALYFSSLSHCLSASLLSSLNATPRFLFPLMYGII